MPLARRAGQFLAVIWSEANRRFGTLSANLRKATVDVWLTHGGDAGGEQFRNNLYIYDYAAERTNVEWMRELAHEFGHYLLPGASGYTSPESWSNGLLGERLFLRWLRDGVTEGWISETMSPLINLTDLNDYCAKQVVPLIDRIKSGGIDNAKMRLLDRKGMDEFSALMLYIDEVYGSATILNLLDYLKPAATVTARGSDFTAAFSMYASAQERSSLMVERNRAVNVYLPAGRLLLECGAKDTFPRQPGAKGALSPSRVLTVSLQAAGWQKLIVAGKPGLAFVAWKRLSK